jgi:hypothetical protein
MSSAIYIQKTQKQKSEKTKTQYTNERENKEQKRMMRSMNMKEHERRGVTGYTEADSVYIQQK